MRHFILWLLFCMAVPCMAQVGVGTNTPAASAILDVSSDSKGFLPPRLNLQQIKNIAAPQAGLMVYYIEAGKPCYYNGRAWYFFDNIPAFPQPGIFYPPAGGVIIYLDVSGLHGIVAASSNLEPDNAITWGCPGFNIPGAQFSAIGTGQSNTNAILSACPNAGIAARLADQLVLNGFSDWYLPSVDELQAIYMQKAFLPGINNEIYWSSTQVSTGMAKGINFTDGSVSNVPTNLAISARAVRSF